MAAAWSARLPANQHGVERARHRRSGGGHDEHDERDEHNEREHLDGVDARGDDGGRIHTHSHPTFAAYTLTLATRGRGAPRLLWGYYSLVGSEPFAPSAMRSSDSSRMVCACAIGSALEASSGGPPSARVA